MRAPLIMGGVVLTIVAAVAAFLATQHSRQKLGTPGVRTETAPMYYFELPPSTNPPAIITNNPHRVYLPAQVLDFRSQLMPISGQTVATLPKDTVFGHRVYAQSNGLQLDCQVVLMGADRSSIHKPQYCLKGSGFTWTAEEPATIRISRPHPYDLPVMKLKLRRETRDEKGAVRTDGGVFVYWFVADGELTAQHSERMWWMARDMLKTGVLQRWAYVIVWAPCVPGAEDATFEGLKTFIAAAVPEFHLTAGPPLDTRRAAAP
jgi:hypothetical protein